jgi:hypothetical protein
VPVWILEAVIRAMHAELALEYGGLDGLVDESQLVDWVDRNMQVITSLLFITLRKMS